MTEPKDYFVTDPEYLEAKAIEWIKVWSPTLDLVQHQDRDHQLAMSEAFKAGYCAAMRDSLAERIREEL